MYLTRLKLDPRSRVTRELRLRPYLLHQAIYRAFPEAVDGGPGRVLYRWDTDCEGNGMLLIQSEKKPDWERADLLKACLLEQMEMRENYLELLKRSVKEGQCLSFRLRANPAVKKQTKGKKNGYRLGLVREEEQVRWLVSRTKGRGIEVLRCRVIPEGMIRVNGNGRGKNLAHYAVRFDGILKVTDPDRFIETVAAGIGPAKAFGFGLLSLAPCGV